MTMSRRGFLQIAGISLAATQLGALSPWAALAADEPTQGRMLESIRSGGRVLWPDSVVTILDADATRYRLREGWVARTAVQPMFLDRRLFDGVWPSGPFYAEVSAPVAAIRHSASTDAALFARVGHGGVFHVRRALYNLSNQPEWFEVELRGRGGVWVQAAHILPTPLPIRRHLPSGRPPQLPSVERVQVDRNTQTLIAFSNGDPILTTAISTSTSERLSPGSQMIDLAGPVIASGDPSDPREAVWPVIGEKGDVLGGVHWHNAFGAPQAGRTVQLPVAAARWLYAHYARRVTLDVF